MGRFSIDDRAYIPSCRRSRGISIARAEPVREIGLDEDPSTADARARDLAGPGATAQGLGVDVQQGGGVGEVERFHG
jgi:hypothetical protein